MRARRLPGSTGFPPSGPVRLITGQLPGRHRIEHLALKRGARLPASHHYGGLSPRHDRRALLQLPHLTFREGSLSLRLSRPDPAFRTRAGVQQVMLSAVTGQTAAAH